MLSGQGTGRQRQRVLAVVLAMIVVGAAGCVVRDEAQGMVNRTDRDNFTSSLNSFSKADHAFFLVVNANNANPNPNGYAAAAQGPIDGMKHAAAQMDTLSDKVTGNAHTIATTLWQAATGRISAAEKAVFADAAHDNDLINAANTDEKNSGDELRKHIDAWNAL